MKKFIQFRKVIIYEKNYVVCNRKDREFPVFNLQICIVLFLCEKNDHRKKSYVNSPQKNVCVKFAATKDKEEVLFTCSV